VQLKRCPQVATRHLPGLVKSLGFAIFLAAGILDFAQAVPQPL
jgi:hypothetical protein